MTNDSKDNKKNTDFISKITKIMQNSIGVVQIDSRKVEKGDIFIALKGSNTDGHLYIDDALSRGAACCIVSHKYYDDNKENASILYVNDTYEALLDLALYTRSSKDTIFIGITGSVGKTTVKDFIKIALGDECFASRGNYNNALGVPINLASLQNTKYAKYAVLEMGMNSVGEIRSLAKIVHPNISIITSIAPTHIEFFDSVEKIAHAKSEIFEHTIANPLNYQCCDFNEKDYALTKNSNLPNIQSIAILPVDSEYLDILQNKAKECNVQKILTFGTLKAADAYVHFTYENEIGHCYFNILGEKIELVSRNINKHNAINLSIVLLLCKLLGYNLNTVIEKFSNINITQGRGNTVNVCKYNKTFSLINDSYNSSPISLRSGLENIKHLKNKVLILGDMLELGAHSKKYHEEISKYIDYLNTKCIILVGEQMESLFLYIKTYFAVNNGVPISYWNFQKINGYVIGQYQTLVLHFTKFDVLSKQIDYILSSIIDDKDVIYIKGSRGTSLYKLVEKISL